MTKTTPPGDPGKARPAATFRDVWVGPRAYRAFSKAVQMSARESVPDDMVRGILGDDLCDRFRLAETMLRGKVRKTTGEPALAHSADIALHAKYLGFGPQEVGLALCHDVVEDAAKDLPGIARHLARLASRFGYGSAHDVRLITNRYTPIYKLAAHKLRQVLPFNNKARQLLVDALCRYRDEQAHYLQSEFSYELQQLISWFAPRLDLSKVKRARVDLSYQAFDEVALRTYELYVVEMADAAASRKSLAPLIVKSLDLIDNLRTSEVVTLWSMDRARFKTEMFLDRTFWLTEPGHLEDTVFPLVYDCLKNQLVEQLRERSAALTRLSDTRFWLMGRYYRKQIERLEDKFRVDNPVEELARLKVAIRAHNAA